MKKHACAEARLNSYNGAYNRAMMKKHACARSMPDAEASSSGIAETIPERERERDEEARLRAPGAIAALYYTHYIIIYYIII